MSVDMDELRALVEALNRGDPAVTTEFNEFTAIDALQNSGSLPDLPWQTRRRGDPKANEPDWIVTDKSGAIVAGFEVTELDFVLVRRANAKLERLRQTGGAPTARGNPGRADDLAAEAA